MAQQRPSPSAGDRLPWNWHPPLPIGMAPTLVWPPRPAALARWLFGRGYLLSAEPLFIGLAVGMWFWLWPDIARFAEVRIGWIVELLAFNAALMIIVAGGLHLYFFTFRRQGTVHRYETRELARDDPRFLWRDQVRDNMFWSLAGAVPIWTAFEVLLLWAWANGIAPWLSWGASPVLFVALFPLLYIWESIHFFAIHRLLHWKPLYRSVHALHHKNIVVGPWSGMAMHPVEQALYLSTVLIHLIVISHPIHMIYLFNHTILGGVLSHVGYADLQVRGRNVLDLASLYHQVHHRYFNCNYGNAIVPCDRWAGSFHDGTANATAALMHRQRQAARGA